MIDVTRFNDEVSRLKSMQGKGLVFYGSSILRLWPKTPTTYLGLSTGQNVFNLGFGGARLVDMVEYARRLFHDLEPDAIVIYGGDNDLAEGYSPTEVAEDMAALIYLMGCWTRNLIVMGIKPSMARWELRAKQQEVNRLFWRLCRDTKGLPGIAYCDLWDAFTLDTKYGTVPNGSFLAVDGLHLNGAGYQRLADCVRPFLPEAYRARERVHGD